MTDTPRTFTAPGMAARTAAILFVFVIIFTALLSGAYQWTKPAIEASASEEKMKLVDEVLPRSEYDNKLLEDTIALPATAELGLAEPSTLYIARRGGQPVAMIFEAVAPDGYAGKIRLIVAVRNDGAVAGVRVTQHKETPGLGDYIDPRKDRRKDTPWIAQFTGATWAEVDTAAWTVRKDGGSFDYRAGATISARAVTRAAGRSAAFAAQRMDALFAAPAGGLLGDTQ